MALTEVHSLTGDEFVRERMTELTPQVGPISAYLKVMESPAAHRNRKLDADVAQVLAHAHSTGDPISYSLRAVDISTQQDVWSHEGVQHTIPTASDERTLISELPLSAPAATIPVDFLLHIKLQSGEKKSTSTSLNYMSTVAGKRAGVVPGVSNSMGSRVCICQPMYEAGRYAEYASNRVPISEAYLTMEKGASDTRLCRVRVCVMFNVPRVRSSFRNGISDAVSVGIGFEGYMPKAFQYTQRNDPIPDHAAFHASLRAHLEEDIGKEASDTIELVVGNGNDDGRVSKEHSTHSRASAQSQIMFLGDSTFLLSVMAFLKLFFDKGNRIEDLDSEEVTARLLGGEDTETVKALRALYLSYYAANRDTAISGREVRPALPTVRQLFLHTSGLPRAATMQEQDIEEMQLALIATLADITAGKHAENVSDTQVQAANEEEFARRLSESVQLHAAPDTVVLPGSNFVEGALLAMMLVRLADTSALPEQAILAGLSGLVQLDEDAIKWNLEMTENGKSLEEGDDSSLYSAATGAATTITEIAAVPAFFLRSKRQSLTQVIDAIFVRGVALSREGLVTQYPGWQAVTFKRHTLYYNNGGGFASNISQMWFVPELNLWGVLNAHSLRSTPPLKLLSAVAEIIKQLEDGKYKRVGVTEVCAPPAQHTFALTMKHIGTALSDMDTDWRDDNLVCDTNKVYTSHVASPITGTPTQIRMAHSDRGTAKTMSMVDVRTGKSLSEFVYDPVRKVYVTVEPSGVLGEQISISKAGVSAHGAFYSSEPELSKRELLQASYNATTAGHVVPASLEDDLLFLNPAIHTHEKGDSASEVPRGVFNEGVCKRVPKETEQTVHVGATALFGKTKSVGARPSRKAPRRRRQHAVVPRRRWRRRSYGARGYQYGPSLLLRELLYMSAPRFAPMYGTMPVVWW